MILLGGSPLVGLRRAIFAALIFCACTFAVSDTLPADFQKCLADVYSLNKSCVVKVTAQKNLANGDSRLDSCSGFLAGKDGIVLTSAFVTYEAARIWVECCGVLHDAESLGFDPLTSISVIRLKSPNPIHAKSFIKFDASSPMASVASPLLVISRELGLPPSPRMGLVSGQDINFGDLILPAVYLRTNIPSFNGSIGSPAFDMHGNFAGMMVASLPATNGSFIIPARAAARIRDDIILCGEPVYGWFGLQAADGDDSVNPHVAVNLVVKNGPADKAGFRVGDIISEINGEKISNNTQLRNITFYLRPGETAHLKVLRGSETLSMDLLVAKMDSDVIRASSEKLKPQSKENSAENKDAKNNSEKQ